MQKSIEVIESMQNKWVKASKALLLKKNRQKEQMYLLEGSRYIKTLMEKDHRLDYAFCSKSYYDQMASEEKTWFENLDKHYVFSDKCFEAVAQTQTPQGMMGAFHMKPYVSLAELEDKMKVIQKKQKTSQILLIDGVQDPGNLGTIVRTADAVAVDLVILTKGCADLYNDKTLRSAAGSVHNLIFTEPLNAMEAVKFLKNQNYQVIVTALKKAAYYRGEKLYHQHTALVVGNEGKGVSQELIDQADLCVKMPMLGGAESLNVAVACGVMLYEILENHSNFQRQSLETHSKI